MWNTLKNWIIGEDITNLYRMNKISYDETYILIHLRQLIILAIALTTSIITIQILLN